MVERSIVGLGELLWDIFPDGSKRPGGAPFNFAFHCHQLGHKTVIVSRVGDDPLGYALLEFVRRAGLSTEYIQLDPTYKTGQVDVTLDANGVPSYEFNTSPAWQHLEWSDQLKELAKNARVLCHGSLAMLGQTKECLERMISRLEFNSDFRICDLNLRSISSGSWLGCLDAEWLKLNEEEAARLYASAKPCHELLTSDQEHGLAQSFFDLSSRTDRALIITRGERGATIYLAERAIHCKPPKVKIVDTVGAGDAFTAALTCQRLSGADWETSLQFAVRYAAKVCEYRGATPKFDPREIA
jgi:fructokinase